VDLNSVTELAAVTRRAELPAWRPGDAFLAGGTWLFSEPQPDLRRLVDLTALGWPALEVADDGLHMAATCTIAELAAFHTPPDWVAAPLIGQCCRALLGSFKVWNAATVGGNICLGLAAGPMTSLTAALDGTCVLWTPDGGTRRIPVADFVLGPRRTRLRAGEVLREVVVPLAALRARTAFRAFSLSPVGRSAVVVIGRVDDDGGAVLTVTASTPHPVQLRFGRLPGADELSAALVAAEPVWLDDVHGDPRWRAHLTGRLLSEVRDELTAASR
jgi:CO/xanthine dehydrogenase FAD-binding subunit